MTEPIPARHAALDALRGFAVLWMTAFHFAFDLNHSGYIQQNFYTDPFWTVQRTCIVGLFLFCAGFSQACAQAAGQSWRAFWRRWLQVAGCAVLVSAGSMLMFPKSWIYFGVLHGIAAMLLVCRLSASWGRWLWLGALVAIGLGLSGARLHGVWPELGVLNGKVWNWIGLISHKPITEDYVPLLPWLGMVWCGMATGQWLHRRGWMERLSLLPAPRALAWLGRWSLSWYMLHQPVLIGLLLLFSTTQKLTA